jgi:hypothetical protein
MSAGEKYVAAAYAVVFLTVLLWVTIIAAKLARLEREGAELQELLPSSHAGPPPSGPAEEDG